MGPSWHSHNETWDIIDLSSLAYQQERAIYGHTGIPATNRNWHTAKARGSIHVFHVSRPIYRRQSTFTWRLGAQKTVYIGKSEVQLTARGDTAGAIAVCRLVQSLDHVVALSMHSENSLPTVRSKIYILRSLSTRWQIYFPTPDRLSG